MSVSNTRQSAAKLRLLLMLLLSSGCCSCCCCCCCSALTSPVWLTRAPLPLVAVVTVFSAPIESQEAGLASQTVEDLTSHFADELLNSILRSRRYILKWQRAQKSRLGIMGTKGWGRASMTAGNRRAKTRGTMRRKSSAETSQEKQARP